MFFRYGFQRAALRAGLAFSQQVTPAEISNCADCLSGETASHTLTWRAGGQYAVLPQVKWLYTFLDVAYRATGARGEYTGGFCGCLDNTVTATTRMGGAMAGIGAALHPLPRFYLSPELYIRRLRGAHRRFIR
ncbi:hypothetical protein [Hymenobacter terricola]|uniref:hypothetical protein n=1 Tax=Hymenobacter terricola TaxID=2819236 RepID=UPI001B3150F2|nr:hypothetical protein [Hymenobacter terricola]